MAAPPTVARPPYNRRDIPEEWEHGWWVTELGNIQRSIPTYAVKRVNTLYTPTAVDRSIICDCTVSAVVIGLQAPNRQQGLELIITHAKGAFPVTVIGTVSGVVDPTLPNLWDSMTIMSDGEHWLKIASNP